MLAPHAQRPIEFWKVPKKLYYNRSRIHISGKNPDVSIRACPYNSPHTSLKTFYHRWAPPLLSPGYWLDTYPVFGRKWKPFRRFRNCGISPTYVLYVRTYFEGLFSVSFSVNVNIFMYPLSSLLKMDVRLLLEGIYS